MPYVHNPVRWAGIVVQLDDGTTYGVELDGRSSLVTFEITQSVLVPDDPLAPYAAIKDNRRDIDVRITGIGVPWNFGAANVPRPAKAIQSVGELPPGHVA